MGTKKCTLVTRDDTAWSNGWYAIMRYGNNSHIITVDGTVNLILCDNVQYYAQKGIVLNPGSHLIIWGQSGGTGLLYAYGENYYAGIGGGSGETGSLTINGGKIDAYGGKGAAALGSGTGDSGIITINGGKVSAKGSDAYVDSEGASANGTGSGTMNNIYFYGGTTTAIGGYNSSTYRYYPPIGSGSGSGYTGSIHLAPGMEMKDGKLDANGRLASDYKATVTVKPQANAGPAYTVGTDYDEELGTITTSAPMAHADDEVTVTATPATGCELVSLSVTDRNNNPVALTDGKITMPSASVTVNAVFQKIDYTVTVDCTGYGTASADKETANYGDTVTLPLTPDGEECEPTTLTVVDSANNQISVENNQFIMPDSNVTVTVVYGTAVFKITNNSTGPGTVTAPETAENGSTVALTVTPNDGCKLKSLTVTDANNNPVAVSNDYKFTMPASAVTVTAEFEADEQRLTASLSGKEYGSYTVSVNGGDPVNLSTDGSVNIDNVKTGDTITVTFSPAADGCVESFYLQDSDYHMHNHKSDIQNKSYSYALYELQIHLRQVSSACSFPLLMLFIFPKLQYPLSPAVPCESYPSEYRSIPVLL